MFRVELRDLRATMRHLGGVGGLWTLIEKASPDAQAGRETFLLGRPQLEFDWATIRNWSANLRARSQKKERRLSEMAAHLAVKKHLGQGVGQDSNHGERDQGLTTVAPCRNQK
jgi:hypothetical protein